MTAIQAFDLRLDERGVERCRPGQSVLLYNVARQFDLNAVVVYLADVSERRVETCDHRHRHVLKQVVRVAVEELDRASDALVEESKVKAHIEIVVGFPSEVFVAQR